MRSAEDMTGALKEQKALSAGSGRMSEMRC